MAKNFAAIAFTDPVKALQEKYGSRAAYARMEQLTHAEALTEDAIDFISERDSFYMATQGANGYPYIQHRGGPKGFIKVLDNKRIGFTDFRGNLQYVSLGNLQTNDKVALIMVDYPARARLKIYARAEIVEISEDPGLYQELRLANYQHKPERMMVFHIEAFDWNCPQHITPRYTTAEIEAAFADQRAHIANLQSEIKLLQQQLKEKET